MVYLLQFLHSFQTGLSSCHLGNLGIWKKRGKSGTEKAGHGKMANMLDWSIIGRRVFMRLLRWGKVLRHTEPVYRTLFTAVLVLVILAIVLWRQFGTSASLPVLADMMPILLAIAGIIMSFVPPRGLFGDGPFRGPFRGRAVLAPKSETRGSWEKWGHSAVIMEMTDEQTEVL
jgi:hypothetical protein